jgi:hypothetical protein
VKEEIYKKLAATGKYYNTGKVLIGVQYTPKSNHVMSRDEERIQSALLGYSLVSLEVSVFIYALYCIGLVCFATMVVKAFL